MFVCCKDDSSCARVCLFLCSFAFKRAGFNVPVRFNCEFLCDVVCLGFVVYLCLCVLVVLFNVL